MKSSLYRLMVVVAFTSVSVTFGQSFTVSVKVYLEGPFNGVAMNSTLNSNNYLPLSQPYNTAPWNYGGTENVPFIPNADVVDWVLLELRETAGDASTAYEENIIARQAGFILSNGNIVSTDGMSPLQFGFAVTHKLFAVLYHRNHLAVLSGGQLVNAGGNYTYDFTTGAGQAYGGANAHKETAPGIWGMVSGDGDGNGQVNNADKNDVWNPQAGYSGYRAADFNLNGQVDNVDKNDHWKVNSGRSSQFPGRWECGKVMADNRDGQLYSTVQIGTQCWMKKNLNVGNMIQGSLDQTNNGVIEKYCYANNPSNCDAYGGLYQWNEMMQYVITLGSRGLCPANWHLPADPEWCTLELYLDNTITCSSTGWRGTNAGTKLKQGGSSGFEGLLGGYRNYNGNFYGNPGETYFWTSSQSGTNAWARSLYVGYATVYRNTMTKVDGFSVRCLLNKDLPPEVPSNPSPVHGAINQGLNTTLSWICTDPDNDPLTYDIYFGTTNPPQSVLTGNITASYDPGPLLYNTTYYWKIVAIDDDYNNTEGPVWSFTTLLETIVACQGPLTDPRDGQVYNTVQIGNQCWMAENLNIGTMINGGGNQTNNGVIEKYCYANSTSNCDLYGGLYQWDEAMQYVITQGAKGICPDNWHLPADADWCVLEQTLDNTVTCSSTGWRGVNAGTRLKVGGNSGFEGLLGGYRNYNGNFLGSPGETYFWTSSQSGTNAWARSLYVGYATVYRNTMTKVDGFSVRCLLNKDLPPEVPSNPSPVHGATDQGLNTTLSWTCTDPDNDPLTYDIYFGTTNPPPSVLTGGTTATYNPGPLLYNTTYYWKIIAIDDDYNNTEGPVWSFTTLLETIVACQGPFTDIRDGQVYNTVQIGNQCWMAENLNIGTMINGGGSQTNNGVIEKYCYANSASNCDTYGGLYQWDEAMQYVITQGAKGICPDNWHIPADADWCVLEQALDNTITCGSTGWRGTNAGARLKLGGNSGFDALMTGWRNNNGNFLNITGETFLWSSYQSGSNAWIRSLYTGYATVYRGTYAKSDGFSVRCLLNTGLPPGIPSNPSPVHAATSQPLNTTQAWTCTDPDNDPLTYDIYFGTTNPPPNVLTGSTATTYNPGPLLYNTTYYWKIVAVDDDYNNTEGPVWSFTTLLETIVACQGPLTDPRDGQVYNTVQIGNQCWMAENLNIGTMINGSGNQTNNGVIEKYCYANSTSNCDLYGGLYQWDEMMGYLTTEGVQGICPVNWHLPTDAEWCVLEQAVDNTITCGSTGWRGAVAGTRLKVGGNSGFDALMTGWRNTSGSFLNITGETFLWSSTQSGSNAWIRSLYTGYATIYRGTYTKLDGFSVRCLADNLPPLLPSDPQPPDGAGSQSVNLILSWTCSDPDGDPLTYDVYFGSTNPPAQVSTGQAANTYNPGTLSYGTPYYWKIAAHDDHGHETEGPVWSFTTLLPPWQCGDLLLDTRDNQTYLTVQVGTQCWMAENLNIGTMTPGTSGMTNDGIIEKYCHGDNTANCDLYGGLYQWDEMMQYINTPGGIGICPPAGGWHLPTDSEFCTLTQFIDPTVNCGVTDWSGTDVSTKMKSTTGWVGGGNGTNTSGFTALAGSYRDPGGFFDNIGYNTAFWSSNENGSEAWNRYLNWSNASIYRSYFNKNYGFSVRCVADNLPPNLPSNTQPPDGAGDQSVNIILSWSCSDPDGDPLTYDVFFGSTNPPAQVSTGQTADNYNPGTLGYGTTYYWKIVAHDDHSHTTEGPVWSFATGTWVCGTSLTDSRDGQVYLTVAIGAQCWMAENLNIGTMIPGTSGMANNGLIEKYCYGDNTANCVEYGALYQWDEMMGYVTTPGVTGICPENWHLPTDAEWCVLEQFVDPTISCASTGYRGVDGGGKLKESGTAHWWSPNQGGTNASGFTALPGGYRYINGAFDLIGRSANFWTSSVYSSSNSWFRYLHYTTAQVGRDTNPRANGFSVRCVKI